MRINRLEERMDDNSSLSHQNGGGGGGNLTGQLGIQQQVGQNQSIINKTGGIDDCNGSVPPNTQQYTIPGILHFLQHEWARFELERSQWDVDRAELQVNFFWF